MADVHPRQILARGRVGSAVGGLCRLVARQFHAPFPGDEFPGQFLPPRLQLFHQVIWQFESNW